jgi:hypothetical protein
MLPEIPEYTASVKCFSTKTCPLCPLVVAKFNILADNSLLYIRKMTVTVFTKILAVNGKGEKSATVAERPTPNIPPHSAFWYRLEGQNIW